MDDDDGNLANGTPNSAALYAAFNRHGIACTTDAGANVSFRGCAQPAVPTLSLTAGSNQVTVNWSGSSGVYDVYRTENGCTVDWRGIQTCTARAGTKIFRFGSTSCTTDYGNSRFAYAQPNGTAGISVPAGSNTTRLSFWHRRAFETGYDGGALTVSVDGASYFYVPASAILSGTTYNGTVAADCPPAGAAGALIFTGTASTFTNTTVNLDAACNAATGLTSGCAGRSVRIGFTGITDCSVTGDGWFLDDVTVTACQ